MAVHLWTTPHAVIAHRAHSTTTTSNQMAKRSTFENGEKWGDYPYLSIACVYFSVS